VGFTKTKLPRLEFQNGVSIVVFKEGCMFLGPQNGAIIESLGSTSTMGGMAPHI